MGPKVATTRMVVIADTTPLNHLLLIGCQLYLRVLIPAQVLGELRAAKAPPMVRGFAQRLPEPEWIEVHEVRLPADRALARLDAGEAAVIVLAQRLAADLAIIDETQGRREAASRNLAVTGTLTVLLIAAERGLIDFPPTVARLRQSGFRASTKLIERFLVRDRTRRESRGSKGY